MTRHAPITVAVDGSAGADAAIDWAATEARRIGTGLRLVHVVPTYVPIAPMMPLVPEDLSETGRTILAQAAERARRYLPTEDVTTSLLHGGREWEITAAARGSRMVVLGHENRPLVDRLFAGATLSGVVAQVEVPVVVVPEGAAGPRSHHCVAVGVRTTDHAVALVRRGFAEASATGSRLLVVHAWELTGRYDELVDDRLDLEQWSERAARALEREISQIRVLHPEVPLEVRVVHGQPAQVLVEASREADLLVVARRAHAFPSGHLGSTGRAVVHGAQCPVEVLPVEPALPVLEDLELESGGAALKR